MKANILICGYTGAGKTSLIQSICGNSIVPDNAIHHGRPETIGFNSYEYENFRFWDSQGMETGKKTEKKYKEFITGFIKKTRESKKLDENIHVLWYCIDGSRARVTGFDKRLIKALYRYTLVLVTKSETMKPKQLKAVISELTSSGVKRENIICCSSEDKTGLGKLFRRTCQIMPKAYDFARKEFEKWLKSKEERLREIAEEKADSYIFWGTGRAAAIAISPIPLAGVVPLVVNEGYMITMIGGCYGVAVTDELLKKFGALLGGSTAGKIVTSFFPGIKIFVAAGITYGIGCAAQTWFESGMQVDANKLKAAYKKGKKEAKSVDWKSEAEKYNVDDIEIQT